MSDDYRKYAIASLEQWCGDHMAKRMADPALDLPVTRRDILEMLRAVGSQQSPEGRGWFRFYASRFWSVCTRRTSKQFPNEHDFYTWGSTEVL